MTVLTRPRSDAELIAGLAALERLAVYVYARALRSGQLSHHLHAAARQIAGHEREHADSLIAELPALGASAALAPGGDAAAEAALARHHVMVKFASLHSSRGWLRLLISVEEMLERNYHAALAELGRPALLRLCAEIMASEAQHSAVLGELLEPHDIDKALPNAFVNGT
jgi:Ferritin-like domain